MSSKPQREDKPNDDRFSEALRRIEQARKTGAAQSHGVAEGLRTIDTASAP